MYNRYIPKDTSYSRIPEENPAAPGREYRSGPGGQGGPAGLSLPGKEIFSKLFQSRDGKGFSGLLKGLRLEEIDTGDILLLLILLYLVVEGDDLELVIALWLVLLMGFGEKEGS